MKKEPSVLESIIADISKAVDAFSEQDSGPKQMLDQLSGADAARFFAAGIHVVATGKPSAGVSYLVLLLAKDKRLSNWLLDAKGCTLKEATSVARAAADQGVQMQAAFEMALNKALQGQASAANTNRVLRILNLLEAIASQSCWNSFQVELMAYPDKVVRSKAALLIGRSGGNAAWIVRRLLDRDPRVQANAVEALWGLDAAESKPHLLAALKSKNNRVFANAALGLYRVGDSNMIRALLEATQHPDPLFRVSALWAIGQTQDPRFLPALSLQFKTAEGKMRLALAGAIARIRQRQKLSSNVAALDIHFLRAAIQPDGKRQVAFTLSSRPAKNLSGVKATEFLIWENGALVEDYQARSITPSGLVVAGFIAPWFESAGEPFEKGVQDGLNQCLSIKRSEDQWRIDRYAAAAPAESADNPPGAKPTDEAVLPYDDPLVTPPMKTAQCCASDPEQLRKILEAAVPRERAATDATGAIQRQCKAISQRPGRRHLFVLLHELAGADLKPEAAALLRGIAKDHALIFHAISAAGPERWPQFRDLCLSNPEGSFIEASEAGIGDGLVRAYAGISNKFEISYLLPATPETYVVKLKVAGDHGSGQAEVTLESPPVQPEAAVPIGAEPSAA